VDAGWRPTDLKARSDFAAFRFADEDIRLDTARENVTDDDVCPCNLPCVNVTHKKVHGS
jgi:hypothetical protein